MARTVTTRMSGETKMTIIKEGNLEVQVFKFNSSWWWADFFVDGVFDASLREKRHTKKEVIATIEDVQNQLERELYE